MVCKKCGAEMDENAFFCGKCGAREGGKAPCQKCGKLNVADALYCGSCGYRLDGKTVCKGCGKTVEGNNAFCVYCGASLKEKPVQKAAPVAPAASPVSSKKNDPWATFGYAERKSEGTAKPKAKPIDRLLTEQTQRMLATVGSAILMLGALLSLLFCFFIGMEFSVKNVGDSTNSLAGIAQMYNAGKGQNIFFFFGDCQEMFDGWNMYAVVGAGVAVVTFAVVGICSLVASVAFVKGVFYDDAAQKQTANVNAMAAIIGFLMGVIAFYSCTRQSAELLGIKETTTLNLMTKIGVVAAIILCVFGVLLCMVGKGREYWTQRKSASTLCTVVGLGAVIAALICGGNVAFNVTIKGMDMSLDMNYPLTTTIIEALAEPFKDTQSLTGFHTESQVLNALNSFKSANNWAQLFLVLFIVFATVSVRLDLQSLTEETSSGTRICMAACTVIFSGLTLLCTAFANAYFKDIIEKIGGATGEVSMHLSAHIFCFMFSIVYLGAHLRRRKEESEQIALEHWIEEQKKKEANGKS